MTEEIYPAEDGRHLILDLFECGHLPTHSEIYDLFERIIKVVHMNILVPPIIVKGAEHDKGLIGVCIIETSHLSIHTFENTGRVAFDIYSCKDFDEKIVCREVHNLLLPKLRKMKVFAR